MEERNELAELLGAYYHSKSDELKRIPEIITKTYDFNIIVGANSGWRKNELGFNYEIGERISSDFYEVVNNCDKDLLLDFNGKEEAYSIKVTVEDKAKVYTAPEKLKTDSILIDYLEMGGTISKDMKGSIDITVNTNAEFRRNVLKSRLGIPKDYNTYVKKLCAAGAASSGYSWYRSARGRLGSFNGTLLNNIWHMNKPVLVETANRLYGLTIKKSYKLDKIHDMLKNVPYTDFGIKNVAKLQELENLVDKSRYTSDPEAIHQGLDKLGIGERPVKKKRKAKKDD